MSKTRDDDSDEFYRSTGRIDVNSRGGAWNEWLEDLARYRAHYNGGLIRPLLLEQSLWALLVYRLASGVYRSSMPFLLKQVLLAFAVIAGKLCEIITGVGIAWQSDLLPGLYIGHYGTTLIGAKRIGPGCNIGHGVTIGLSGRGARRGVPTIGARVFIGAHAVVAGDITIGDDVVIGANSLVTRSVPPNSTAVGVPAKVMPGGTAGMGLHQRPSRSL